MRITLVSIIVMLSLSEVAISQPPAPKDAAFYRKDVAPLMKARCLSCHSGATPVGGLKRTTRADILKGASGPAVDLKKPEMSLLLKAVNF